MKRTNVFIDAEWNNYLKTKTTTKSNLLWLLKLFFNMCLTLKTKNLPFQLRRKFKPSFLFAFNFFDDVF
jgi:hypothetical protein